MILICSIKQPSCSVLTFLSLTTRLAQTATMTECLFTPASIDDGFTPLVMGLENVWGKTHDHRKVRKSTNYRCSTSPGGIQVVDLYFPKGGTMVKMIE
jgi:hypothetical protein